MLDKKPDLSLVLQFGAKPQFFFRNIKSLTNRVKEIYLRENSVEG